MMASGAGTETAARLIAGGASMLSLSVLADSGIEHYRGSFANPAMVLPIAASGAGLILNGREVIAPDRSGSRVAARAGNLASALIGVAGLGFHLFNVGKQPGGFRLNNIFYKAPVGAPAALALAGIVGAAGWSVERRGGEALGGNPGRTVGAVVAGGLLGTVGEAGLLHFRGAYHNPAMWLPVTLPPIAAACLARDSLIARPRRSSAVALAATAALGVVGSAFHAFGVARNMGGWRNWRQTLLAGPPVPAPPALTGLALAGLGALLLMRRRAASG
jgi:hypothetical protein